MAIHELGPARIGAEAMAELAEECLSCMGFDVSRHISLNTVILQACKEGWLDTVTGRRCAVAVRLTRSGGLWKAESGLVDWRMNIAFFCCGALLGPVGWSAAALSVASRLWGRGKEKELFDFLRRALED